MDPPGKGKQTRLSEKIRREGRVERKEEGRRGEKREQDAQEGGKDRVGEKEKQYLD